MKVKWLSKSKSTENEAANKEAAENDANENEAAEKNAAENEAANQISQNRSKNVKDISKKSNENLAKSSVEITIRLDVHGWMNINKKFTIYMQGYGTEKKIDKNNWKTRLWRKKSA